MPHSIQPFQGGIVRCQRRDPRPSLVLDFAVTPWQGHDLRLNRSVLGPEIRAGYGPYHQ